MSEDTWLDVGANIAESMRRWVTGQASMDQSREFSPQQLLLLQELFKAGAVGMAEIVAKQLCALDTRITTMEQSPLNQCEATTLEHAAQEADASSGSSKTKARRQRRQKAKSRYQYDKTQLLSLRPCGDIINLLQNSKSDGRSIGTTPIDVRSTADKAGFASQPCVRNKVAVSIAQLLDGPNVGRRQSQGIDAVTLQRQCSTVRKLQSWWQRCRQRLDRRRSGAQRIQVSWRRFVARRNRVDTDRDHTNAWNFLPSVGTWLTFRSSTVFSREEQDTRTVDSSQILVYLMVTPPYRAKMKKYCFVRSLTEHSLSGSLSACSLLHRRDVDVGRVDLYSSGKTAVVSYRIERSTRQEIFDVDNLAELVQLIQQRNIQVRSHLQKAPPSLT